MGWYFRKSKSVGPFRVNFSKSGISFSAGIKGARVSFGPKGTFVNVGGNGIYYRKKLGSSAKGMHFGGQSYARNNSVQYAEDYAQTIDTIKVQEQTEGISVTNQAIVNDIKRTRLLNWLWVALSLIFFFCLGWWTLLLMLALRVLLRRFFRAEISYEMDAEAALEWEKFFEFLSALKTSKKLWIIEASQSVSNTKVNAGAVQNLARSPMTMKNTKANRSVGFGVFSNSPCIRLKGKPCTILFLPCDVIIKKGKHIVACSYKNLRICTDTVNFIENDSVPKDATIVRYTWQYVNKNGSADMRYANNRQLPVCEYGSILLQAGDQIGIEIYASNTAVTTNIEAAFQYYADYLEKLSFHNQKTISSAVRNESINESYIVEMPINQNLCKQPRNNANEMGDMATNGIDEEQSAQKETKGAIDADSLLAEAFNVILETGQASVSMLQRRLNLAYAPAARLMDEMEEKGLVGPFTDSRPRTILVTREQWNAMRGITPKPIIKNQSNVLTDRTVAEDPPIVLRNFTEFSITNGTISVCDNEVHVSKKVMTRYGSGTTTAHFTGDSFSALVYKKPRLFSSGYIEFKFKDKTDFTNNQPHLIDVSQSNIAEFLRSEFSSAQARLVYLFLRQLAEDAHVPITEL